MALIYQKLNKKDEKAHLAPTVFLPPSRQLDASYRLELDLAAERLRKKIQKNARRRRLKRLRSALLLCAAAVVLTGFSDIKQIVNRASDFAAQMFEAGPVPSSTDPLYTRLATEQIEAEAGKGEGEEVKNAAENTAGDAEIQETSPASTSDSPAVPVDAKLLPITRADLSSQSLFTLSNATSYSPNLQKLFSGTPSALCDISFSEGPLVLIVHTHGGECYSDYDTFYPEDAPTRSLDRDKNVVSVGSEIAKTLSDFGIGSVHCTVMHDEKSFINAYNESASSVEQYLEMYPSIRFVIDVHRDAIIKPNGESIAPTKTIGGKSYAQIMFVVGTNERGHDHPNWQENLALALKLQDSITSTYPGLCRSINLRDVPFNQWLSDGYLLLEVGSCANSLEEAKNSARAFGENLARVILAGD